MSKIDPNSWKDFDERDERKRNKKLKKKKQLKEKLKTNFPNGNWSF